MIQYYRFSLLALFLPLLYLFIYWFIFILFFFCSWSSGQILGHETCTRVSRRYRSVKSVELIYLHVQMYMSLNTGNSPLCCWIMNCTISWKLSKQLKKKDKEHGENKVKEEAVSCRFKFSVIKYEFVCVAVQMFRSIVIIVGWQKNKVFFLFGRRCMKKKIVPGVGKRLFCSCRPTWPP